jgi:hypothetical protein
MSYPPPVSGGNILIDAGIGLGFGYKGSTKIPPIFAQVEYALPQIPISVGGLVSFWQTSWDNGLGGPYAIDWTYNYLAILGRGNWHWGFDIDWLDLYSGLSLGYRAFWTKYTLGSAWQAGYKPEEPKYGGFDFGFQLGAHFYFTEKIGAMVELGYPMMRVGIAIKL